MPARLLKPLTLALCLPGPWLASPVAALAAEPSPSEISVARALFDQGLADERAGRWREAAGKFRSAAAIKDTPGLRFHVARCEEEQGLFVEALLEYDRARELLDAGNKAADVEKLLPAARERVKAKVALLTLRVPDGVQDASVRVDGKPVSGSVLGVPMPVNPGTHRVQAASAGRKAYSREIVLDSGEALELALELPAVDAPPEPAPARPLSGTASDVAPVTDAGVSARSIALVSEASLFAVGLGTGVIFSIARRAASDRYEQANRQVLDQVGGSDPDGTACNAPRAGCSELQLAGRDRDRAGKLAVTGFVVAGVSAAAFGLTWWLWPAGTPEVTAGIAPGRVDLGLSGRF